MRMRFPFKAHDANEVSFQSACEWGFLSKRMRMRFPFKAHANEVSFQSAWCEWGFLSKRMFSQNGYLINGPWPEGFWYPIIFVFILILLGKIGYQTEYIILYVPLFPRFWGMFKNSTTACRAEFPSLQGRVSWPYRVRGVDSFEQHTEVSLRIQEQKDHIRWHSHRECIALLLAFVV